MKVSFSPDIILCGWLGSKHQLTILRGHISWTTPFSWDNNTNLRHTILWRDCIPMATLILRVPAGSPSRGGDVTVYVKDINQPSLPTPFYSVLVSVSVFVALSTVFHSINSPDNSLFSHSVLPVLSLPYWSFQPYISLGKSSSTLIWFLVVDWAQNTN